MHCRESPEADSLAPPAVAAGASDPHLAQAIPFTVQPLRGRRGGANAIWQL
jgi:hypothetical protein